MKKILLIGIGGTGSEAVDILDKKIKELEKQNDNDISAIVLDTDTGDIAQIKNAVPISMADNASVGTICDTLGKEYIREWFPCDEPSVRAQEMIKGAAQWRKKSYLAFLNAMNKPASRSAFIGTLEKMTLDPNATCEVYIIASIAGGTGSGTFIPLALFVRHYLRRQLGKNPLIYAMIALPDIYADQQTKDNKIKVYANAYAILRELNAINLVTRGYNKGNDLHKKSPINFKIGNIDEPNVGLLFDAKDEQFWTPEAAPFNQIFLLDRIPNVNSVKAHNIVLANSLYTLLCTEIGAKFDSEASNHELLRSQNNGSNAIFAGISTSQINFPIESILNYLAHTKTVESCEGEWLTLHKEVEKEIKQREENAKDCGQRYIMKEAEYSEIFTQALNNEINKENPGKIVDIVEADTARYNAEGKKDKNPVEVYFKSLVSSINAKLPDQMEIINNVNTLIDGALRKDKQIDDKLIARTAGQVGEAIKEYYDECINAIRRNSRTFNEAILSFEKKDITTLEDSLSLIKNVLCKPANLTQTKKIKFIHPVSALAQLCKLRILAETEVKKVKNVEPWSEIKRGEIDEIREELLELTDTKVTGGKLKLNKSVYYKAEKNRFSFIIESSTVKKIYNPVKKVKSDYKTDLQVLKIDAKKVIENIRIKSIEQLSKCVFEALAPNITLLIEKYRVFFNRFTKEKEDLIEETKTAQRMDSGINDSVINVYSTQEDKEKIKDKIFSSNIATVEAIENANDIAGKGVFETVFASACAARNNKNWNEKDSSSYKSLFANMVAAYKKEISESEAFEGLASSSVIEAMVESAQTNDLAKLEENFREAFSKAQKLATPSLKVSNKNKADLVEPSYILVYMLSYDTAKYIKKNADKFGLALPSDQSNEGSIIVSCAEQFVRRYASNNNVRVAVVKNMPSKVLYCTGEIMDITPLRIEKFDELSEEPIYYNNYVKALARFKEYCTEMWNPHIGNNLHKRGFLPYMNKDMELECDKKMVKALLHGLSSGKISYDQGYSKSSYLSFRYIKDGIKDQVRTESGDIVTEKTIAQLISWIRNEDDLIEQWCADFDADIFSQKNALPIPNGDSDIAKLEARLTTSDYMKQLTKCLFKLGSKEVSILEFAYKVKNSEESSLDCDDAERILYVAYDTFIELIAHRAPQKQPEKFIQIYKQQIEKVYKSIFEYATNAKTTQGEDPNELKNIFTAFIGWLNFADTFKNINPERPVNSRGEVVINETITFDEVKNLIEMPKKDKVKKDEPEVVKKEKK